VEHLLFQGRLMIPLSNLFRTAILLIILSIISSNVTAELILGIHPYRNTNEIQKNFLPLAKYLSSKLGEKVTIKVGTSYEAHIGAVRAGVVDIGFFGPALYVSLTETSEKWPLLARLEVKGMASFFGDIVVRKESPFQKLDDLKGSRFAFGDSNSTMAYKVPIFMLEQAGITKKQLKSFIHLRTHDDVALSVLMGNTDAGAVKHAVFKQYADKGLRSLVRSPEIAEHVFVAKKGMPDVKVKTIRQAMLNLQDKEILNSIKHETTALVPVKDSDYNILRKVMQTETNNSRKNE